MKIIVSIKQVPDTSGKVAVNPDGTLNRASMQTITNPDDMNALEAALETEEPWVEILLLAQEGKLFLRVSNPYTGSLDPGKLWEEGWSTKGTGRGLGLSGYQRILRGYPNASSCTSWDRGIFVQELTVEDRT